MSQPYHTIPYQQGYNNQTILNQYHEEGNSNTPYDFQGENIFPSHKEYPQQITSNNNMQYPSSNKNQIYLKQDKPIQQYLNYVPNVIYKAPYQVQKIPHQLMIYYPTTVPQTNPPIYTQQNVNQINTNQPLLIEQKQNNNQKINNIPLQPINNKNNIVSNKQNIYPFINNNNFYNNVNTNTYQQNKNQILPVNTINNNIINTPYNTKDPHFVNQPIYEEDRLRIKL